MSHTHTHTRTSIASAVDLLWLIPTPPNLATGITFEVENIDCSLEKAVCHSQVAQLTECDLMWKKFGVLQDDPFIYDVTLFAIAKSPRPAIFFKCKHL